MRALPSLQIRARGKSLDLLFRHVASATHVLLSVLVVDQQLAVLAEAVRFVAGDGDDVENTCTLLENSVHLFEGAVCSLRIEEVDYWEDKGVAVGIC